MMGRIRLLFRQYLQRILATAWQTFLSSLSVTQAIAALSNGGLHEVWVLVLAALGAIVASILTLAKNFVFRPTATGVVGIIERVASTFAEGAIAAVPVELLSGLFIHYTPDALRSVGLAVLGGGTAALFSLIQNSGQGVEPGDVRAKNSFNFYGVNGAQINAWTPRQFIAALTSADTPQVTRQLSGGNYSDWIGTSLGNAPLASSIRTIEQSSDSADVKRISILALMRAAYGIQ